MAPARPAGTRRYLGGGNHGAKWHVPAVRARTRVRADRSLVLSVAVLDPGRVGPGPRRFLPHAASARPPPLGEERGRQSSVAGPVRDARVGTSAPGTAPSRRNDRLTTEPHPRSGPEPSR